MIIISCKERIRIFCSPRMLLCLNNDYIKSIEIIDDGINDVIIKQTEKRIIYFYNLDYRYHNPFGPAIIYYNKDQTIKRKYYYCGGTCVHKENLKNAMKDYYK